MLLKLLPLRSSFFKEDKQERSLGMSPSRRLLYLRFNSLNLDKEGNIRAMEFILPLWITLKREERFLCNLDDPLHPLKDKTLRFFN
ncbi:hypothetical protein CXB51_029409 [Gossypium anomalum]|uniref:Uncharacterized protein n=1 Tax=Gossypium anomalum TaxID=47600 RepID=A0A8J6CP86_9ROSI|nr:hypothetical protein CXB51_029409 [Gossypium anomalum]